MKTAAESVLKVAAKAMSEARAGNVGAIAIISVSPEGVPDISFAGESELVCQVNTGADMLKHYLLGQIVSASVKQASGLVRPAAALDG